jgi:hypothetical protein
MNRFAKLTQLGALALSLVVLATLPNIATAQDFSNEIPTVKRTMTMKDLNPETTGTADAPKTLMYLAQTHAGQALPSVGPAGEKGPVADASKAQEKQIEVVNRPGIFGSVRVGKELQGVNPTLRGISNPIFSYQWYRCKKFKENSIQGCTAIPAANELAYTIAPEDLKKFIVLQVTIQTSPETEVSSSAVSISNHVGYAQPYFGQLNFYNGTPTAQLKSATQGDAVYVVDHEAWQAQGAGFRPSFEVNWYSCAKKVAKAPSKLPNGCRLLSAGNQPSRLEFNNPSNAFPIRPAADEIGRHLLAQMKSEEDYGSFQIYSKSIPIVNPLVPLNASPPHIVGSPAIGGTVTIDSAGVWSAFKWFRCSKPVKKFTSTRPAKCSEIPYSIKQTHPVFVADAKKYLSLAVSVSAGGVAKTFWTASSQRVPQPSDEMQPPRFWSEPYGFYGTEWPWVGWYVKVGEWTGSAPISVSAFFYSCNSTPTRYEWTVFPGISEPNVAYAPVGCEGVAHDRPQSGELTGAGDDSWVTSIVISDQYGIISRVIEGPGVNP